jgi:hypothetical protein
MKTSLQQVHVPLFIQVNSQESRVYIDVVQLEIVLGSDAQCKQNVAQGSSRCILRLLFDASDVVISSTD